MKNNVNIKYLWWIESNNKNSLDFVSLTWSSTLVDINWFLGLIDYWMFQWWKNDEKTLDKVDVFHNNKFNSIRWVSEKFEKISSDVMSAGGMRRAMRGKRVWFPCCPAAVRVSRFQKVTGYYFPGRRGRRWAWARKPAHNEVHRLTYDR